MQGSSELDREMLLMSEQRHQPALFKKPAGIIGAGVVIVVIICTIASIVTLFVRFPSHPSPMIKRNVIMMVSDGMGPASVTLARNCAKRPLLLDQYLVGTVQTPSNNSVVTDSAAGATAYSCGKHTYNGGIGVDSNGKACGTVLEAAAAKGMRTGLVVTTRLTDATPASFASHARTRDMEEYIALQLLDLVEGGIEKGISVLMGGGGVFFNDSTRSDGKDIISLAKKMGYQVASSKADLSQSTSPKLFALFADRNMPYEIDRIHSKIPVPSLADMTRTAIEILNRDNDQGFFLLVEGSQVDIAGHNNDAAAHVYEVLGYEEAFGVAVDFAKKDGQTLVLSTSDHETGGLTLGMQRDYSKSPFYGYYPDVVMAANASSLVMAQLVAGGSDLREVLATHANVSDLTDEDEQFIMSFSGNTAGMSVAIGKTVSSRAQIGWSTAGHTGIDVNLYAYLPHDATPLKGSVENISLFGYISKWLSLDVETITSRLGSFKVAPVK